MNTIRLGLFQESSDRFSLAVHSDTAPRRMHCQFGTRDLRAALVSGADGTTIRLLTVPAEVAQARELILDAMSGDPEGVVTGGIMALDTFSDSWSLTILRDSAPGYHVALAFSFFPLRVSFGEGSLVHMGYEAATEKDAGATWSMLHPAVATQAAAVVFPNAPTVADGCALLASRPGVVEYLVGTAHTFSLSDFEKLARDQQVTASVVVAPARGAQGEDRTWLYRVKLSERSVAQAGSLAVSFARAKARHLEGLHARPPRDGLQENQLQFRAAEIDRWAHHLALLQLCIEFGIGLWSCPASRDDGTWLDAEEDEPSDQWSVAVNPE